MKPLPKFIAVVHVENVLQALEQTKTALDNGAGGVFLIHHSKPYRHLLAVFQVVREDFPEAWIGLNFLDLSPRDAAYALPANADGLWLDNADGLSAAFLPANRNWRVFPGAAFKYQRSLGTCENEAARVSAHFLPVDVVTTSGPGTGQSANVQKVERMKSALGSRPLALASGVTPENVTDFSPFVDCFLVATGISKSFHEFDPDKVRQLAEELR